MAKVLMIIVIKGAISTQIVTAYECKNVAEYALKGGYITGIDCIPMYEEK